MKPLGIRPEKAPSTNKSTRERLPFQVGETTTRRRILPPSIPMQRNHESLKRFWANNSVSWGRAKRRESPGQASTKAGQPAAEHPNQMKTLCSSNQLKPLYKNHRDHGDLKNPIKILDSLSVLRVLCGKKIFSIIFYCNASAAWICRICSSRRRARRVWPESRAHSRIWLSSSRSRGRRLAKGAMRFRAKSN